MEKEIVILTNREVIDELRTRIKPYIGLMAQSVFSNTCTRIYNDLCKPSTVKEFFSKFGYSGSWDKFERLPETKSKKR